jgi:hypothetical protein
LGKTELFLEYGSKDIPKNISAITPIFDSHSIPTKVTLSGFWLFSSQVHYFRNDSTQVHINANPLYAPEPTAQTSCASSTLRIDPLKRLKLGRT